MAFYALGEYLPAGRQAKARMAVAPLRPANLTKEAPGGQVSPFSGGQDCRIGGDTEQREGRQ